MRTSKYPIFDIIRNVIVTENKDVRIKVNRKSSSMPHQQNQRPASVASPILSPSKGKGLIRITSYDKERESALSNIQHGDILLQSPGMY